MRLPKWKAPEAALVEDGGTTVYRVRVAAAAGTIVHALDVQTAAFPQLSWRWKIDRVVEKGDLDRKAGDDFSARVYVYFDVPRDSLSFGDRTKLRIAELATGVELPNATICYVWDNRHAIGTTAWSAYTDRVRVVVLESGNDHAGEWRSESRDLAADFRAAFGNILGGEAPRVKGLAIGNDTDQTRETVTAWFGDFRLGARP
jgi:hypothetical protein